MTRAGEPYQECSTTNFWEKVYFSPKQRSDTFRAPLDAWSRSACAKSTIHLHGVEYLATFRSEYQCDYEFFVQPPDLLRVLSTKTCTRSRSRTPIWRSIIGSLSKYHADDNKNDYEKHKFTWLQWNCNYSNTFFLWHFCQLSRNDTCRNGVVVDRVNWKFFHLYSRR